MEGRNPYAAPTAPVISADEPTRLPTDPENFEYGGFWRRVGAATLDSIILLPLAMLLFFLTYMTSRAYLYWALPSLVISLSYHVYLVLRFGGTPGKRITGMRITMADGSPVTAAAAAMRYAPFLVLQLLFLFVMIQATLAPVDGYESMKLVEKIQALQAGARKWNKVVTALTYIWWLGTLITLVANSRKRAAHDFIAGTVVLRTN